MLSKSVNIFLSISFIISLSCSFNTTYDEVIVINDGEWAKDQPVHFIVEVNDTVSSYQFMLSVHNGTEYRYSNLYLFLITEFPNGNLTRDTIECVLADQTGKWFGKGWGNIKENEILLKPGLGFPLRGTYNFYLQQAMRQDTLRGIHRVGIKLAKNN